MIIAKLMGGLGNQLFQYALGRKLSIERGVPLKFDINWFATQELRRFELNQFNIHAEIASKKEIDQILNYSKYPYLNKIISIIYDKKDYNHKRFVIELQVGIFDPRILTVSHNCFLDGYWQSEKYFSSISEIIRSDITFVSSPNYTNSQLLELIKKGNSVSVHIRRGDYISNRIANDVLGTCSIDYYNNAISYIIKKIKQPSFFVFSDDMEWVKDNIVFNYPVYYCDHNMGRGYDDLRLMSRCKYHIIANSSFSWWAAWLGDFPSKIVVAPKKWFKNDNMNSKDIICNGWVSL